MPTTFTDEIIDRRATSMQLEAAAIASVRMEIVRVRQAAIDKLNGLARLTDKDRRFRDNQRTRAGLKSTIKEMDDLIDEGFLGASRRLTGAKSTAYRRGTTDIKIAVDALPGDDVQVGINFSQVFKGAAEDSATKPLVIGRSVLRDFESLSTKTKQDMSATLTQAVINGESIPQTTKRLQERFGVSERAAERISRTHLNAAVNNAHIAQYNANPDVFKGYKWDATFDSRTSRICARLHGTFYPLGSRPPGPPAHPNALVSTTYVNTSRGRKLIKEVRVGDYVLTGKGRFRRVYAVMSKPGKDLATFWVKTDTGRELLITEEHPVLTVGRGWQRAENLKTGDEVFEYAEGAVKPGASFAPLRDTQNAPSVINEEPFFRGVDMTLVNRTFGNGVLESHFPDGAKYAVLASNPAPAVAMDHAKIDRFWIRSRIIHIEEIPDHESVFNLGVEEDETFIAEGILVHNCRSILVGVFRDPDLQAFEESTPRRTRTGISDPKKGIRGDEKFIPSDVKFDKWLKDQSPEVQRRILGTRTKQDLFERGYINTRDVTGEDFLYRKNKEVVRRALAKNPNDPYVRKVAKRFGVDFDKATLDLINKEQFKVIKGVKHTVGVPQDASPKLREFITKVNAAKGNIRRELNIRTGRRLAALNQKTPGGVGATTKAKNEAIEAEKKARAVAREEAEKKKKELAKIKAAKIKAKAEAKKKAEAAKKKAEAAALAKKKAEEAEVKRKAIAAKRKAAEEAKQKAIEEAKKAEAARREAERLAKLEKQQIRKRAGHRTRDDLTDEEKIQELIDAGLSRREANDAIETAEKFTGGAYARINRAAATAARGEDLTPDQVTLLKEMDDYIKSAPAWDDQSVDLIRGMGVPEDIRDQWMQVGGELDMWGYKSASTDLRTATDFARDNSGGSEVPLFIKFRTKRSGVSVKYISHFASEDEVIFPRDKKFRIESVEEWPEKINGKQAFAITVSEIEDPQK